MGLWATVEETMPCDGAYTPHARSMVEGSMFLLPLFALLAHVALGKAMPDVSHCLFIYHGFNDFLLALDIVILKALHSREPCPEKTFKLVLYIPSIHSSALVIRAHGYQRFMKTSELAQAPVTDGSQAAKLVGGFAVVAYPIPMPWAAT